MTSGDKAIILRVEQPQGLCDLIGLAFRIWRSNLKLIFRSLLMPTIFFFASIGAVQWCIIYGVSNNSDLPKIIATIGLGLVAVIVYLIALTWLAVQQLALVRLFTGFAPDWPRAIAFAKKKIWWLVGLFFISAMMSSVVMGIWICMLVLSGAVANTGAGGAALAAIGMLFSISGLFISIGLLILISMMGFSVVACEDTTFFGVIGQAFRWTFKHFGRVFCFGFIFYVIFSVVSMPVSLPVIAASVADMAYHQIQTGAPAASDYKTSLPVMLFIQVWEGICSLLLRPLTVISFGLLYLDLRQRVDGIDMTSKLGELKLAVDGAEHGIQGR